MAWIPGALAIGGSVVSGVMSNNAADEAASGTNAALVQQYATMQQLQKMLQPYRKAGKLGLSGQLDLLGLNGSDAQQAAIAGLENSPQFTALVKNGEEAILQNASATGGLRGGNTQAALAQFRPQMLSQLIESQYGKLADLSAQGQNAAAGTGAFMQNSAGNISQLLQQQGMNSAMGEQAQGQNYADLFGQIAGLYGKTQGSGFAPGEPNGSGGYWNFGGIGGGTP